MNGDASVRFFDSQFRRQLAAAEFELNPFESVALPHLRGRVLDYGCGLGNLAVRAARQGCAVLALDASPTAIDHLRTIAQQEVLPLRAEEVDLRNYELADDFDVVVCIGLLMFFDCQTAYRQLSQLQAHVRPGGLAVINVLTEGTTYMDMFAPDGHCLFKAEDLRGQFVGWDLLSCTPQEFSAPGNTRKSFVTLMARKPGAAQTDA